VKIEDKKRILRQAANELKELIEARNSELFRISVRAGDCVEPGYHDYQTCHELVEIANEL